MHSSNKDYPSTDHRGPVHILNTPHQIFNLIDMNTQAARRRILLNIIRAECTIRGIGIRIGDVYAK